MWHVAFVQLSVAAFRGQEKKRKEEYISNTIYLANVTHFPWAKYVIKLTLISPLDCS